MVEIITSGKSQGEADAKAKITAILLNGGITKSKSDAKQIARLIKAVVRKAESEEV